MIDWFRHLTPDWLSAIGGIVTALIALYLLGQGERQRIESRRVTRQDQASKVSISKPNISRADRAEDGKLLLVRAHVAVHNKSADAISDVYARAKCTVPDDEAVVPVYVEKKSERLDENEMLNWVIHLQLSVGPVRMSSIRIVTEMYFTDVSGTRWWRDEKHVLRKVSPRNPSRPALGDHDTR